MMLSNNGDVGASVMILGSDAFDLYAGQYFHPSSRGGMILSRILKLAGHVREDFSFGDLRDVARLQPKCILALGDAALFDITGMGGRKQTVDDLRGYVLRSWDDFGNDKGISNIPVVCSYSPASLLGRTKLWGVLAHDILRACEVARDGAPQEEELHYNIAPTEQEALALLGWCKEHPDSIISCDIENPSSAKGADESELRFDHSRIEQIQFTVASYTGYAFPWIEPFISISKEILALLNPKVGHNWWEFDLTHLEAHGCDVRGAQHDTMWMFHILQPDLPKSLQYVASFFEKNASPWKHTISQNLARYGCKDSDLTFRLYHSLLKELSARKVGHAYHAHTFRVQWEVLDSMKRRGIYVNREAQKELKGKLDEEIIKSSLELQAIIPDGVKNCHRYKGVPTSVKKLCKELFIEDISQAHNIICDEDFKWLGLNSTKQHKGIMRYNVEFGWYIEEFFSAGSPLQLKRYMESKGHAIPKAIGNSDKDSTGKKQLQQLLKQTGDKVYEKVLELRALSKLTDYIVDTDENFLIHSTIRGYGTSSGQMSSHSPNCFSDDTEVMTENGWKLFSDVEVNERVAQFDTSTSNVSFAIPTHTIKQEYIGDLLHIFTDEQIDMLLTPNHDCLLKRRYSGEFYKSPASELVDDRIQFSAGYYDGGGIYLSDAQLTLITALQADGHVRSDGYGYDFSFSKRRKIIRFSNALEDLNVTHSVYHKNDGKTSFYIAIRNIPEWWKNKKHFGPWVLQLQKDCFDFLSEEIWFWDGCLSRRSMFSSSYKPDADWVQIITCLSGRRAKLRSYWNGNPNSRMNWQVDAAIKAYSMTTNHTKEYVTYSGFVYCFTMPLGTLIVRRNGKVAITGNCQNWPKGREIDKVIRNTIQARPGHKLIAIDLKGFHAVIYGFLSEDIDYIRASKIDVHSYVTAAVLRNKLQSVKRFIDPVDFPGVKSEELELMIQSEGELKERLQNYDKWMQLSDVDLSEMLNWVKKHYKYTREKKIKHACHGINNGLSARGLYDRYIENFKSLGEAQMILNVLRITFPKLFKYQQAMIDKAHNEIWLYNPFGYRRGFYEAKKWDSNRGWVNGADAEEIKAYMSSSTAHGYYKEAILRCAEKGWTDKYWLTNLIHDEMVFDCPSGLVDECIENVSTELEMPSPYLIHPVIAPEGFSVETDAQVGNRWGSMLDYKRVEVSV